MSLHKALSSSASACVRMPERPYQPVFPLVDAHDRQRLGEALLVFASASGVFSKRTFSASRHVHRDLAHSLANFAQCDSNLKVAHDHRQNSTSRRVSVADGSCKVYRQTARNLASAVHLLRFGNIGFGSRFSATFAPQPSAGKDWHVLRPGDTTASAGVPGI